MALPSTSPHTSSGSSILIAEDDRSVRENVTMALRLEGYAVTAVGDGTAALAAVAADDFDALVLDVMMPFADGFHVCRELRRRGDATPVLLLTARHEIHDRVAGLDAGADDYLVKPFALDELLARLRALIRRNGPTHDDSDRTLAVGDLTMDIGRRTVTRGGEHIELTKTEFDLLELLLTNVDLVLSRETIYERIWGYDFETSSKSLDVYIGYLRRKTEREGEPRLIHTVRGVGYVAREP